MPTPLRSDVTAPPTRAGSAGRQTTSRSPPIKSFAEANPVAVALFEAVTLDVADISAQSVRYDNGENSEADVTRHAAEWVAANRTLVDEWLETARAAGG
jgi:glycine betaine/proline transport system substrate-binding protein